MHILNKTLYNQKLQGINKTKEELYKIQEAISTGKQINRPSDNPEGTRQVLNYRTILATVNQYSENIDFARDWCWATNDALEAAKDFLIRCREIAHTQADSSASQEGRQVLATEVDGIYQDLLDLANTEFDERYLFAPAQLDTPPFDSATVLEDPPVDSPPEFFMQIKIGDEKETQINTSQDAFIGGEEGINIFQVVNALKTGLENNDPDVIRTAIGEIDQALEQITKQLGVVGTKIRRLDRNQEILTKVKNTTETSLSQREDADLVEKLMDYVTKSNNYSISLSTLSNMLNTNLLDLIG